MWRLARSKTETGTQTRAETRTQVRTLTQTRTQTKTRTYTNTDANADTNADADANADPTRNANANWNAHVRNYCFIFLRLHRVAFLPCENIKSTHQYRPPSWKFTPVWTSFKSFLPPWRNVWLLAIARQVSSCIFLFFVAPEGTYPRGIRDAFRQLVSIQSIIEIFLKFEVIGNRVKHCLECLIRIFST